MSGIKDYSLTPSSNTSINSIDISEVCPPSSINNAIRQKMADTRSFYESGGFVAWGHTCTYASGTSFSVSGDVTAVYVANRRLRAVGSSTGTIYGKVASSSYSAPNTTVTVTWDSGSLSNEALTVSVGWVAPTGSPVYVNAVTGPGSSTDGYIPQWSGTGGGTLAAGVMLDTDTTLAANSDTRIASQKAVKAYADAAGKPAFKNMIINGDFQVNQRAFAGGSLSAGAYGHDRWKADTGGASYTVSGNAATISSGAVVQVIEGALIPRSGTYVINWTGTATCSVDGVSKSKGGTFSLTAGTNCTVKFTGGTLTDVQLEVGSSASAFEALPADVVLGRCQRYFETNYEPGVIPGAVNPATQGGVVGVAIATSQIAFPITFKTRKRADPTMTFYSWNGSAGKLANMSNTDTATVSTPWGAGVSGVTRVDSSGLTVGAGYWGYYTASAEL